MKKSFIFLLMLLSAGCQHGAANYAAASQEPVSTAEAIGMQGGNFVVVTPTYTPGKPLSDYAADLALQLAMSLSYQLHSRAIAITSLVEFDATLDSPSALGNQLSEHLYYQLQRLGLSVSDIKLAQQVQITPVGDFALSRSKDLDTEQQLNYVLTGTLLRDKAGVVVNVRVIQRNSKAVVATAQVYIPSFIVAAPAGIQEPYKSRLTEQFSAP